MNCHQTQTLLDAYADDELGRVATYRVRRHLAACLSCTAEMADIQHLNASVHAWRDVSAPADLGERLAAALPQNASAPTSPRRNPQSVRRAAVGLAGIAAAIGAGFWLLPGHPSQPTLAFADVEQALEQVETLSWVTTTHNNFTDQTGHEIETDTIEQVWLRRKPAAIATLEQAKGYPKGLKGLADSHGQIFQYADNAYQTYKPNANANVAKGVERDIRRMTQIPTYNVTSNPNASIRSNFSPLQEYETKLNGYDQILFVRKGNITVITNPASLRMIHIRKSIWVDSTTRHITQIEIENVGGMMGPNSRSVIIYSDFHYNQLPRSGVFDWSPLPGAKVEAR